MAGNSFGKMFRITTFGESHGIGIGVIIDGCPAGLPLSEEDIQIDLDRRKPGQSSIVTQRKESDIAQIQSGVFKGVTTGTPISIYIKNKDQHSSDYEHIKDKYRPSHADYVYDVKYGIRDHRGGGRSSARETAARVAAGAIAKKLLATANISITAFVTQVGKIKLNKEYQDCDFGEIENNIVRVPDAQLAEEMIAYIKQIRKEGNTVGGRVACVIQNCPVGLGQPVFDKLHADLGKAMLSINAVKGFEYGSGFDGSEMLGSEHNDVFVKNDGQVETTSNYAGGILGGISNGMDIYFNTAFKPVATLMRDQDSIDNNGEKTTVKGKGRHDPCVVPRAVPIVEAMAALVIADHYLRAKSEKLENI